MYQAGTLSGNPLAMAAGIAQLKHLRGERGEIYPSWGAQREAGGRRRGSCKAGRCDFSLQPCWTDVYVVLHGWASNGLESASKCDTGAFGGFFEKCSMRIYLPPSQFEAAFRCAAHTEDAEDK
jgi:glutamate-1-semialdehyde 2,1-aminomutase